MDDWANYLGEKAAIGDGAPEPSGSVFEVGGKKFSAVDPGGIETPDAPPVNVRSEAAKERWRKAKAAAIDPAGEQTSAGTKASAGPRPPRSGPARNSNRQAIDLSGFEGMALAIHMQLAALLKAPELVISPDETTQLRIASENVLRHFDVHGMSQRTIDMINFVGVAGTVYGTRLFAIKLRKEKERMQPVQSTRTN